MNRLSDAGAAAAGFFRFSLSAGTMVQMLFLAFFLTDACRIPAAAAAAVLFLSRAADLILHLFTGDVFDKCRLKEKHRFFLRISRWILLFSLFAEFTFLRNAGPGPVLALAFIGFVLHNTAYSFSDTAYKTALPVLSYNDPDKRMQVIFAGMHWQFVSRLVIPAVSVFLIVKFSAVLGPAGYTAAAVICCIPHIFASQYVSSVLKKADPDGTSAGYFRRARAGEILKALFRDRQTAVLLVVFTLYYTALMMEIILMPYYYARIVGNLLLFGAGFAVSMVIRRIFTFYMPEVSRKLGKKKALVAGLLGAAVFTLIKYFARANWMTAVATASLSMAFASLFTDIGTRYFEDGATAYHKRTGRSLRPAAAFMAGLAVRLGFLFGSVFALCSLSAIGYTPDMVFTPELTMTFMACWVRLPAVLLIAGAVISVFGLSSSS